MRRHTRIPNSNLWDAYRPRKRFYGDCIPRPVEILLRGRKDFLQDLRLGWQTEREGPEKKEESRTRLGCLVSFTYRHLSSIYFFFSMLCPGPIEDTSETWVCQDLLRSRWPSWGCCPVARKQVYFGQLIYTSQSLILYLLFSSQLAEILVLSFKPCFQYRF